MSLGHLDHGLIPQETVKGQAMMEPWETNSMTLWQKLCLMPDLGLRQGHSVHRVASQLHSHNIHHE